MKDYFSVAIKFGKMPFLDVFSDPHCKDILYKQWQEVTFPDGQASFQKYKDAKLPIDATESEIYDLWDEFYNLLPDPPEEYFVPDIQQTPIYVALSQVNTLMEGYRDLCKKADVDASRKADEYFSNIIDILGEVDEVLTIPVLEKIKESDNLVIPALQFAQKYDEADAAQKRWSCLKVAMNNFIIKFLEKESVTMSNPPSLKFVIPPSSLSAEFDEARKNKVIADDTDPDYFNYAMTGKAIPIDKQPYKPIQIGTKNSLYLTLKDIENKYDKEQKTLTNERQKRAGELFINKKGNLIGKLSNPK